LGQNIKEVHLKMGQQNYKKFDYKWCGQEHPVIHQQQGMIHQQQDSDTLACPAKDYQIAKT